VFGINGGELLILAILAVVVLGPERLPEYAAQLGRLVRELRRMATGAREQLREEVGTEFDDVDWRKLDPRQYDPRRIIKEALLDDFDDAANAVRDTGRPARNEKPVSSDAQALPAGTAAGPLTAPARKQQKRLEPDQAAPFDVEAT
jgi:sec-independent protein translocase protein TatB